MKAQIVRSLAGHDRGRLYCVLEEREDFLYLADGKTRRVNAPKRKRRSHAAVVGESRHPAIEKVRAGQPVGDRELRRALAAFRDDWEV